MNVHPLTTQPSKAWERLSKKQNFIQLNHNVPEHPTENDKLRIVCMSDTHSLTSKIQFDIPNGDVFIHAGDFTTCGRLDEILEFNDWLGKLPHRYKIVIAGNHEISFDRTFTNQFQSGDPKVNHIPNFGIPRSVMVKAVSLPNANSYLTNCIYLQDSEVILFGIKFYGTPWQPEFHNWAFNLPRGKSCLEKWDLIPNDTDILITHTPPIGHGDFCYSGVRAGCVELLTTVQERVKPRYHIFGHIHEGYGVTSDGNTTFINASTCDIYYKPVNSPVVFDISLPPGVQK